MFGFSKAVFDVVISSLKSTSGTMDSDIGKYKEQARELIQQAKEFERQAKKISEGIPNFKWVDVTVTDSEGNVTTTQERQPDPAQDEKDKISIKELLQKATQFRENAEKLQTLVSSLLEKLSKLMESISKFSSAWESTQTAITNSTNLLNNGIDSIRNVISVFNFNISNDVKISSWISNIESNISNIINFDNLNTITKEGLDWFYETGKKTRAKITESFTSGIVGIFDEVVKTFVTGANPLRNVTVFGLGLLGIYTEPQIDPAYIVEDERIDNAKKEAINLYIEYLNTLDISEEEKEKYRQTFEEKIQNTLVLKDEYFESIPGVSLGTAGIYIGKSGGKGNGYIKEASIGEDNFLEILVHEIGGHGTGTVGESKLTQNGGIYIYDINNPNKVPNNPRMNLNIGFEEATTQYITKKICQTSDDNSDYNYSVNLLEKMADSMTKYGICNGESLITETYFGDDKQLLRKQIDEILGNDATIEDGGRSENINYSYINNTMSDANNYDRRERSNSLEKLDKIAEEFDKKCAEYAEKK